MENPEQNRIEFNGKDYRFFTSGYLHREKGPALFLIEEKDKYLNLGDEHLYVLVNTEGQKDSFERSVKIFVSLTGKKAFYYLNDIQLPKEEFDSIILNHQLQQELSNTNNNNKAPKI
jgi:hypothetical protein